jgi:hypothetical protein
VTDSAVHVSAATHGVLADLPVHEGDPAVAGDPPARPTPEVSA